MKQDKNRTIILSLSQLIFFHFYILYLKLKNLPSKIIYKYPNTLYMPYIYIFYIIHSIFKYILYSSNRLFKQLKL